MAKLAKVKAISAKTLLQKKFTRKQAKKSLMQAIVILSGAKAVSATEPCALKVTGNLVFQRLRIR